MLIRLLVSPASERFVRMMATKEERVEAAVKA